MRNGRQGIDVFSRTVISGNVNGERYEGEVEARFNTVLGGSSECTFTLLPENFNPGTIGTHT